MKQFSREMAFAWDCGITLEEAVFMMEKHEGESYIDGDRKAVVMLE